MFSSRQELGRRSDPTNVVPEPPRPELRERPPNPRLHALAARIPRIPIPTVAGQNSADFRVIQFSEPRHSAWDHDLVLRLPVLDLSVGNRTNNSGNIPVADNVANSSTPHVPDPSDVD